MEIGLHKFALYAILLKFLVVVIPIIEKRTHFFITATLCRLFCVVTNFLVIPFKPSDPVYRMTAPQLIENNGYGVEIHHVNNSQHYRLELHRILAKNKTTFQEFETRNPVLLHHGIFCSSADYVVNKPTEGLAYLMADRGYDVWIANLRGNIYSRFNYNISPRDKKFWHFSMDEVIAEDMPILIDYILQKSNQSQLFYFGHSMGVTLALGILSSQPDYNQKVKAFFAFAPAINLRGSWGFVKLFVQQFSYDYFEDGETMSTDLGLGQMSAGVMNSPIFYYLGGKFLQYCTGDKPGSLSKLLSPLYVNQVPTGISKRVLRHLGQIVVNKRFLKYDWGTEKNLEIYKQETPPSYDLNKVTTPTHVFYAANDILTPPRGSRDLAASLPNCRGVHQVGTARNGHMYHIWGNDVSYHTNVIQLMEMYSN